MWRSGLVSAEVGDVTVCSSFFGRKMTNFECSTLEILKNLDLSDKHQSRAET
jgi:hypothetical protein